MVKNNVLRALVIVVSTAAYAAPSMADNGQDVQVTEPFHELYVHHEASGPKVIALWQFDGDAPGVDVSGNSHDAALNGADFLAEAGRFGGALRSHRGWPDIDQPHQARVANHPVLTPDGAFTIEMWIQPAPALTGYENYPTLIDKKYVADTDYQLYLSRELRSNTRRIEMALGFGRDSQVYRSDYFEFPPGHWRHIAFVYDGMGSGRFFVDGVAAGGQTYPDRRSIAPGRHPLSIGDRLGSNYRGFPGLMDQVRLSNDALEFRPVKTMLHTTRRVFERMEPAPAFEIITTNLRREPMRNAVLQLFLNTRIIQTIILPELTHGESHHEAFSFDTTLRPDVYALAAEISVPGETRYLATETFAPITIAPRPLPHQMPVVLWGSAQDQMDAALDIGFTHSLGLRCDFSALWEKEGPANAETPEQIASSMAMLDEALRRGMRVISSLSPGRWAGIQEGYQRIQADGSSYERANVCALFPRVQQFCRDVGLSMTQTYGEHPAFEGALIHTEIRDATAPCFHEHDREAFHAFAGYDIPEGATRMRGIARDTLPDFPENGIIPDDYPWYVYYRWLWKHGDGWNTLHTQLHEGLKTKAKDGFWTFHDPAARCASVFGSGGAVDYLSHWTYSYPDPLRIGLVTDELFAMARGADRHAQGVMKMTQIIWYRSQTAPEPGEDAHQAAPDFIDKDTQPETVNEAAPEQYQAEWEQRIPDARFITIAPMHLREAFWEKIARPVQGIMYHGWGSLVEDATHSSYRHTHPETRHELRRLIQEVVTPLGPTLRQIPDQEADVAMLESFASEMFAGRGTYGWNGSWAGDMYLILRYAGLQPRIVFEETIQQEGLDAFTVLVMPDCDVLPQSVATAVLEFQRRGGVVVGDERLCPAIKADISVATHHRPKEADVARAMNQEKATQLRSQLKYQYRSVSSSNDIILRTRSYGTTDYLFAVNDKREFGDYVGHHGLVMENGLPTDTTLTAFRPGVVYDLLGNRQIAAATSENPVIAFDWHFGPCDGRIFMVTERPIAQVRIKAPSKIKRNSEATVTITVHDDTNRTLDAVVPLEVRIQDPTGRDAEYSGYYGAAHGRLAITIHIAENDAYGLWQINARELAGGNTANAYIRVVAAP